MVIDVFGEVKHDGYPDIIGSDLDIPVVVVGIEEGTKETIVELGTLVWFACLLVSEKGFLPVLVPQGFTLKVVGLDWPAFKSLQVNDLISLALHIKNESL